MRIIYGRSAKITGPLLAAALEDCASNRVINYGLSDAPETCYNKGSAVSLATNKRQALIALGDVGERMLALPNEYPVVGRPDQHTRGKRFYLCHNPYEKGRATRKGATHFTRFIADCLEFRVHVINNKVVRIAEKTGGTGIIHSHRFGWRFNRPTLSERAREPLRNAAKAAIIALGLDFGAVDLLLKEGKAYVLEVNTAPSLEGSTLETYIRHFREL